jgi:hypothetical protein
MMPPGAFNRVLPLQMCSCLPVALHLLTGTIGSARKHNVASLENRMPDPGSRLFEERKAETAWETPVPGLAQLGDSKP